MENFNILRDEKHHIQQEFCTTRPPYRQGKKLTAVKVYTVATESQHLFIYGVPKINLRPELKALCTKYGQIKALHVVADRETEKFTECYHVQFERIQSARIAKRFIDNKSFYGNSLHVCYAPECENLEETKKKLQQRRVDVLRRLHDSTQPIQEVAQDYKEPSRKRKRPALELSDERLAGLDPLLVWKGIPKEIDPNEPSNSKQPQLPQKHYQKYNTKIYGPTISDFQINENEGNLAPKLTPKPILNTISIIKKDVNKRIVFRNKSVE